MSPTPSVLWGWLLVLVLHAEPGKAAEEVADYFARDWYVTEIVVFNRTDVQEFNTTERLLRSEPRRFSAGLRALDDAEESTSSRPRPNERRYHVSQLDAKTRACLDYPTRSYQLTPDLMTTLLRELGRRPIQDAQARLPTGQRPPSISPILEPHPLLDFLSQVADFEADLGVRSYRWLGVDAFALKAVANRLERRTGFAVLLHGAWLQPVPPREAPEPILILAGPNQQPGQHLLEGFISVTLGRFLHVSTELWYAEPGLELAPVAVSLPLSSGSMDLPRPRNETGYMHLQESRRLRRDEFHYLDHPKLGVIVRVDRVAVPEYLTAALERAQDESREDDGLRQ